MKHLVAIVIGVLFVILGAGVLVLGAKGTHTPTLVAGGSILGLGVLLLIPAQAKEAGDTIVSFVKKARATDPPAAAGGVP